MIRSDINEARTALGHEPKAPIGLLIGKNLYRLMVARGWCAPCPVAVSPSVPANHEQWFWHEPNFTPFAALIIP